MKAQPNLTPESVIVIANPNNYYIDTLGRVNELESDEERILYGTIANPSVECRPVDNVEALAIEARIGDDPHGDLIANSIIETQKAIDMNKVIMDMVFGALGHEK